MFNNWELESIYKKVQDLRKEVKENETAYNYYINLKKYNKNDKLYGWIYTGDGILNDTEEELSMYQTPYVRDILTIYKNELENILIKISL